MPPKVKQLIAELERNGFINRGGKGSHRNFKHPKCLQPVRISGNPGSDAKNIKLKKSKMRLTR